MNSSDTVVVTPPESSELEKLHLELGKIKAEKEQLLKAQEEERIQKESESNLLKEVNAQLEKEIQRFQKEKEAAELNLDQLRKEKETDRERFSQEKGELQIDLEKFRKELEETQLTSKQERETKEETLRLKGVLEGKLDEMSRSLVLYREAFAPQVGNLLERVHSLNPDPFKIETLVTDSEQTDSLSKEAGELMGILQEMMGKYEKSILELSPIFPALAKHKDGNHQAILLYLRAAQESLERDTERLTRSVYTLRHLHKVTQVTPSDHTTKFLIALAGLDAILKSELQLSEGQVKEQIEDFLRLIGYIK